MKKVTKKVSKKKVAKKISTKKPEKESILRMKIRYDEPSKRYVFDLNAGTEVEIGMMELAQHLDAIESFKNSQELLKQKIAG